MDLICPARQGHAAVLPPRSPKGHFPRAVSTLAGPSAWDSYLVLQTQLRTHSDFQPHSPVWLSRRPVLPARGREMGT